MKNLIRTNKKMTVLFIVSFAGALLILAGFSASALASGSGGGTAPPGTQGTISGTVTDSSGKPLAGIYVSAYPSNNGSSWGSATTDEYGNYTIDSLDPASYNVSFQCGWWADSSCNYVTQFYNNKPDSSSADAVSVTAGNTTSGINAAMQTGGSITGTVTDQSDHPLNGLEVSVYKYYGSSWSVLPEPATLTDSNGNYSIGSLPSGYYKVEFSTGTPGADLYLGQFYHNKTDVNAGDLVPVTQGSPTTGINAQMAPAGIISGTVTDQAGHHLQNALVHVLDNGWDNDFALTDQNGNYQVHCGKNGSFKVVFSDDGYQTQYYNGKLDEGSADLVSVTGGNNTSGINTQLSATGSVTGAVTDQYDKPLAGIQVEIYQQDANSVQEDANSIQGDAYPDQAGGSWRMTTSAATDAYGNYSIGNLNPGSYRVGFSDPANIYRPQFFNNQTDINSADAVSINAGSTTEGISASLALGATMGAITGAVTNQAGQPLPGAGVVIYRTIDNSSTWGPVGWATADQYGHYVIPNIPAGYGQYKVGFNYGCWDCGYIYAPQFYNGKNDTSSADLLTVTAGGTTPGINAQLQTGGTISGKVINVNGLPLAGVEVTAYTSASTSSDQNQVGGAATTDANGNYSVAGLASGNYKVGFGWPGLTGAVYASRYYNGQADLDHANPVVVTLGQDTAGVNATLASVITQTPAVTNLTGNVNGASVTIGADYGDGTGVGIDLSKVTVTLDGKNITGNCSVGVSAVSCQTSGLGSGSHTFTVDVFDYLGNKAETNGSFTVGGSPPPPPPAGQQTRYFWTWYDNVGGDDWVLLANPSSAAGNLTYSLWIGGASEPLSSYNNGVVGRSKSIEPRYAKTIGGPVKATATGGKGIVSQRILWPAGGNSLEEVLGTEQSKLSNDFYWTWYDNNSPGYTNWILVANPGTDHSGNTQGTVTVAIKIAGQQVWSGTIKPGQNVNRTFPGVIGGPVEVTSTGGDVIASQRVLSNYGAAFNEVPGIPASSLSNDYLWTWYDNASPGYTDWVLVANPGSSAVTYQIKIAGAQVAQGSLNPGQRITPTFPGKMAGPVEVIASGNVITSQRVVAGPSFEEVPGYPKADLASDYNWTWYDNASAGATNWILVTNPGSGPVSYQISIGGAQVAHGTLSPGQRITPTFSGKMGGPVEVSASENVMASQRVTWNGYFNEVLGTVLK